ncbi:MAG: M48 family metallopeptidase [Saprospiraceae bacterium]|nr:M48 family metallopeptidase [Saprospiraceae bacterium]
MRQLKNAALLSLLLCFYGHTYSQNLREFPFYTTAGADQREVEIDRIKVSFDAHFSVPARYDKERKKIYLNQKAEMLEQLNETVREKSVFDDVLAPFVQKVHQQIVKADPSLKDTRVILTAEPVPNAYSVGDGTIVVFTGLLSELENEDQLAFILCHELAHYQLRHAPVQMEKRIDFLQSKAFKEQVKKVETAQYNQADLYEKLVMNTTFQSRYHHRDLERQADSLAFVVFLKTPYSAQQAVRVMQLFEKMDQPVTDSTMQLSHHFGCTDYPFNPQWIAKEEASIWGGAAEKTIEKRKSLADSLSTHPDSPKRRAWLEEMMRQSQPPHRDALASNYGDIQLLSALENVQAWYDVERYDETIYWALIYGKIYPNMRYFKNMLGLAMHGLWEKARAHHLSDVLEQPSPYNDAPYNELLKFLNQLRIREMLELQSCFAQENEQDEYGLMCAYLYQKAKENTEKVNQLKQKYLKSYPKGRFSDLLQSN